MRHKTLNLQTAFDQARAVDMVLLYGHNLKRKSLYTNIKSFIFYFCMPNDIF